MNKLRLLLIGLLVLTVTACVSTSIRETNNALNQAYMTKLQAFSLINGVAEPDHMVMESALLTLTELAKEAQQLAVDEKELRNKIVFYRIAATAAWQSEKLVTSEYAQPGQLLCEQIQDEKQQKEMAAHCTMLLLLPIYAAVDGFQPTYNELDALRTQSNVLTPSEKAKLNQQATELLDSYYTMLQNLLSQRKKFDLSVLSKGFVRQSDQKLDFLVCKALDAANNLRVSKRQEIEQASTKILNQKKQVAKIIQSDLSCQNQLDVTENTQ